MKREEALQYIHEHPEAYLQRARVEGYICPICGSGSGPEGTGIVTKDRMHFTCWRGCFKWADIPDIIAKQEGLQPGSREALQRAYDIYGLTVEGFTSTGRNSADSAPLKTGQNMDRKQPEPEDFTNYFEQCHARIAETDYPQRRGFTKAIIERFKLGYDAAFPAWEKDEEGKPYKTTWKALIIPNGPNNFIARNTNPEAAHKNRYRYNPGPKKPFNLKALEQKEKPVFIVEGQLDALSIYEAGGEAVALGEAGADKLLQALEKNPPAYPLIPALDKDEAGREAEGKLLQALNLPFLQADITGEYKDANEAYNGPGQPDFILAVHAAQRAAMKTREEALEAERREYRKNSVAHYIEQFKGQIAASIDTPFISTGFKGLDDTLEGGLYEGLYLLGAMPSLGKTTLALQMADSIATQGQDVLIFSLEMARTELMAKSISRLTFLNAWKLAGGTGETAYKEAKKTAKSNRGITTGRFYQHYSAAQKEAIDRAIEQYEGFAGNIFIEEGVGDISAEQMRRTIQKHINTTGKTPVCIIDYAQIMQPESNGGTDKQNVDKAVRELKRISRDFKNTVIAISSFNRTNYKTSVSYESFKESGGLEYGSDVVMGLQLKGAGTNNFDADAAKVKEIRKVELKILKNRNGPAGGILGFDYYSVFNHFQET